MSDFGDFDPEDAWDDSDPINIRLALAVGILTSALADPDAERGLRRRIELARLLRKLSDELVP
jgi:hypothetical protein